MIAPSKANAATYSTLESPISRPGGTVAFGSEQPGESGPILAQVLLNNLAASGESVPVTPKDPNRRIEEHEWTDELNTSGGVASMIDLDRSQDLGETPVSLYGAKDAGIPEKKSSKYAAIVEEISNKGNSELLYDYYALSRGIISLELINISPLSLTR